MLGMYGRHTFYSSRGLNNFGMRQMWTGNIFFGRRSLNKFDMPIVSDVLKFTGWQCSLDSLHLQCRLLGQCKHIWRKLRGVRSRQVQICSEQW